MTKKYITPEIIRLSKKIAEKWRMDIYEGCLFVVESTRGDWDVKAEIYDKPKVYLAHNLGDRRYYGFADPSNSCGTVFSEDPHDSCFPESWFPIPDIGDVLRKLKELGWYIAHIYTRHERIGTEQEWTTEFEITAQHIPGGVYKRNIAVSKSLLEACQSALLAVLEGK